MIVHNNVAQGTSAWMKLRAGIPTVSNFDKIITPGGKKSSSQASYMNHLLAERILGKPIDGFQSEWMARGNEFEDRAIAAYELENGCETERIGFVTTDDGRIGCSPDRLIVGDSEAMVEAKSPSPAVHVSYLLSSVGASNEYKVQLQGQLWVCERKRVDIVSYHPDMPTCTFSVSRDEEFIKEMAAFVLSFSRQLEERSQDFIDRGIIKLAAEEQPEEMDESFLTDEDVAWAMEYAAKVCN